MQGAFGYIHIAWVISSEAWRSRLIIAVALLFKERAISAARPLVIPSIVISAVNNKCKSLPADIERNAAS